MLRIRFIKLGGTARSEIDALTRMYEKRLRSHFHIERQEYRPVQVPKLKAEAFGSGVLILMDERGETLDTDAFAAEIRGFSEGRARELAFVVGDAHGFPDKVTDLPHRKIRLSALTLPSDFAWLLLWEQVYRAHTVILGHPYHHD